MILMDRLTIREAVDRARRHEAAGLAGGSATVSAL
ncbi:unnamed protein product, partial [Pylaiella littoralis]